MDIIEARCPQCMAPLTLPGDGSATCNYCGASFLLSSLQAGTGTMGQAASKLAGPVNPRKFIVEFYGRLSKTKEWWAGEGLQCREAKRRMKVVRKHLHVPKDEEIWMVHDVTLIGSMKKGVACTDRGLYICDEDLSTSFISWSDFGNAIISQHSLTININGFHIIGSSADMDNLFRMYTELQERIASFGLV